MQSFFICIENNEPIFKKCQDWITVYVPKKRRLLYHFTLYADVPKTAIPFHFNNTEATIAAKLIY